MKMIWRLVADFDSFWFERTVDGMIATCKFAPLPNDFYEPAALERERLWQIEKEKNTSGAEAFMSVYGAGDLKTICAAIRDRINGAMKDSDFASLTKLLGTVPTKQKACAACSNDGWVVLALPSGDLAYRCYCEHGGRKPRGIPRTSYDEWKRAEMAGRV